MNKIICIGDSLTFGYGVEKESSWVSILKNNFQDEYEFCNTGVNGDTSSGVLSRFYTDVILESPKKVIISVGSNDFLSGLSVEYAFDNMKTLIKDALDNGITPIIGIEPLICADLAKTYWCSYLNYGEINSKISVYRNKIITFCSHNKISFIDFYGLFERLQNNMDSNEFFIDGLHPKSNVHKLMALEAEKVLGL